MKMSSFLLVSLFLTLGVKTSYGQCRAIKESVKLHWTGYKFTTKTPVSGQFTKIGFTNPVSANLTEWLRQLNFKIDTTSLISGNEVRDAKLLKYVFNTLLSKNQIQGQTLSVLKTTPLAGTSRVEINLNSKQRIKLDWDIKKKNNKVLLTAIGRINLITHGMGQNWSDIHSQCLLLHTGTDKVAQTWTDVEVKITAQMTKACL